MRKRTLRILLLLATCLMPAGVTAAEAPDITGAWATYDDQTGQKRSIITISETDGAVSGRITEVFAQPGDQGICVKCEGERRNQPVVGLQIFSGLKFDGEKWRGGKILDPKNGKEYDCELRLDGNELKVRGYLFVFFRTQSWKRP